MTKDEYKALRQSIGAQSEVANRLGVTVQTIINREAGRSPITTESEFALRYLEQTQASGKEDQPPKGITVSAPAVQPAPLPAKSEPAPKSKAVPATPVVRAPLFKPSGKL